MLSFGAHGYGQEKITYQDHVLPLIESHCAQCHNADKKKGDLDLTSYNSALKGGGSGVVLVPGSLDGSKLYRAITHAEDPTMPPKKPKLPDKELDVFKKWIVGGLLETSGSKAIAASKPAVDLTLKPSDLGKPEGPPPMPQNLPKVAVVRTPRAGALTGLAGSPWAPLVALGGQKQVLLYHTETKELLGILPFPEGYPADLKFSRNGKLLVAGGGHHGKSGKVVVWDITNGKRLFEIGGEYDTVLAADISPDQGKIALGGPGRLVKIYSTKTAELLHKIKKHTDWLTALAFSPDNAMLATGDRNGGLVIWDPDNGQELYTLNGHKAAITGISWRDDSKLLASASEDGTVKLWDSGEGKQAKSWAAHSGGALSVNYAHDGRLISCGRDNHVILWDANGSKVRSFEFFEELPVRAIISHDVGRVVASDLAGRVAVWNSGEPKSVGELTANPPAPRAVATTAKAGR